MQPNPYSSVVLSAAIADESAGTRDMSGFDHIVTNITGSGTTSSGVLTIEESADPGQTGTWSLITTVNASSVDAGASVSIHLPLAAYQWIRWRISTVIGGGGSITVTVGAH